MKILVIGSGGREHALIWALARSRAVEQLYTPSHNAGMLEHAAHVDVPPNDLVALADFAARERIDLTVVGARSSHWWMVWWMFSRRVGWPRSGQCRRQRGSKAARSSPKSSWCGITSRRRVYRIVETETEARAALNSFAYPLVIKADGLAAGKGVVVAEDEPQARQAVQDFLVERKLGAAGARLLIEECLIGREVSYLVFTDGTHYKAMPVAQDHKRAFDADRGPNTGGMGAFSAPGLLDAAIEQRIVREVVEPTLAGARADGFPFRGVLYCGLMLTEEGPRVLEYNVRLGDPETQAILRRLDSDLVDILLAVARGELDRVAPRWSDNAATCGGHRFRRLSRQLRKR